MAGYKIKLCSKWDQAKLWCQI